MASCRLSPEERVVNDLLTKSANGFYKLPIVDDDVLHDFTEAIRHCQYILTAVSVKRSNPDFWDPKDTL